MDYIREALNKANAALGDVVEAERFERSPPSAPTVPKPRPGGAVEAPVLWTPREVQLSPSRMKRNRIVSFAKTDPAHISFDMLRTRVRGIAKGNGWTSIGITSPTAACGKTTVALNLAFSLIRAADTRVVLVDLDLKRPSIARTLGIKPTASLASFLRGDARAADCFVQLHPNLAAGLTSEPNSDSSELMQSPRMGELIELIKASLSPDIILFDLPPMGSGDDVLGFLPLIDSTLLVVAAGATTISEVDECERQLSRADKFLGVVMNKSRTSTRRDYYAI